MHITYYIIYSGTTKTNLDKLDKLFYRGLGICDASNNNMSKIQLCHECKITSLDKRREVQLLLFMHKQTQNIELLKKTEKNNEITCSSSFSNI